MSKRKENPVEEDECLQKVYDELCDYFISKGIIERVDNNTSIAFSGPIFNNEGHQLYNLTKSIIDFGMPGFQWQMMLKIIEPTNQPKTKTKTKPKTKPFQNPSEEFTGLIEPANGAFRINICSRSECSVPRLCRLDSSSVKNFSFLAEEDRPSESGKLACLFLLYALFSNNSLSPDNKESIKQMLKCIDICGEPQYAQMTIFLSEGVYVDDANPSLKFTAGTRTKKRRKTKRRRKTNKKRKPNKRRKSRRH